MLVLLVLLSTSLLISVNSFCNSQAKCSDITWSGKVWGMDASGVLLGSYTNEQLQFIGCPGNGCDADTFYCNNDATSITFGHTDGNTAMRSLVGPGTFPTGLDGCCGSDDPRGLCNSPDDQVSVTELCHNLGYDSGTFEFVESNFCPEPHYDPVTKSWNNAFNNDHGFGRSYTCSCEIPCDSNHPDIGKECDDSNDCPECMQCCPDRKRCEMPRNSAKSLSFQHDMNGNDLLESMIGEKTNSSQYAVFAYITYAGFIAFILISYAMYCHHRTKNKEKYSKFDQIVVDEE